MITLRNLGKLRLREYPIADFFLKLLEHEVVLFIKLPAFYFLILMQVQQILGKDIEMFSFNCTPQESASLFSLKINGH